MCPNLSSPVWTRNVHVTEEITLFYETYPAYSHGQSSAKRTNPIFTFGWSALFFASLHYVQCLDNLSSCDTKTPVVDYFEPRFTAELYLECRHKVKDRKYWKLVIVLHVRCVNSKKNLCFHNNDLLFG